MKGKTMAVATENILMDQRQISDAVRQSKVVAVLGIKPESHSDQAAHYVPAYLAEAGLEVIPVPVYFPEATEILGQKVFRKVADIGRRVDIVDIFRRPQDIPQHIDDLIAARPKFVWFQSGIRNDEAAQKLAEAGIKVIQDRCLMVEHRRL
jgi:predicted CoA-binding protein